MIKPTLLSVLSFTLCLPALAEDDEAKRAQREAELRQMRDKEVQRAEETAGYNGDMEQFERKYGWAKEDFREQYNDLVQKRQGAARAWKEAAQRLGQAKDYNETNVIKIAAHQASALAYLSELELRVASAEKNWMKTAEKADTEAAKQAARALVDNQKKMLAATKEKFIREHQLRELERQRYDLEAQLREQYDKAMRKESDHKDRDHKPEPRHEHRPEPKPAPQPEPERPAPPNIRIE